VPKYYLRECFNSQSTSFAITCTYIQFSEFRMALATLRLLLLCSINLLQLLREIKPYIAGEIPAPSVAAQS